MTRAKKSEALMKGLRQAWQEEDDKEIKSHEINLCNPPSTNISNGCGWKDTKYEGKMPSLFKKDECIREEDEAYKKEGLSVNSVLDAVDDPTVTQWVHVVCALWMPGTRCMNVRTMAGFDVSRVPTHRRKLVRKEESLPPSYMCVTHVILPVSHILLAILKLGLCVLTPIMVTHTVLHSVMERTPSSPHFLCICRCVLYVSALAVLALSAVKQNVELRFIHGVHIKWYFSCCYRL